MIYQNITFYAAAILMFFSLIAMMLPFSFFVNIKSVQYHDVCVGDTTQLVTASRDVSFKDGYKAKVFGEVFKYEGTRKIETIIKREIEFSYQVSKEPVMYEVRWDTAFEEVGEYGASDLVTIEPLLIKKTAYFSEDNQRFAVLPKTHVNCK